MHSFTSSCMVCNDEEEEEEDLPKPQGLNKREKPTPMQEGPSERMISDSDSEMFFRQECYISIHISWSLVTSCVHTKQQGYNEQKRPKEQQL